MLLEKVKDLRLDYKALENRTESIDIKIKNADLYIEEIDKHEKSIFDFWKFANKDERLMLNQGNIAQNENKKVIEKVYNYNEDREEIGEAIDKIQRSYLSKEDTDSIYIAGTELLKVLNNIDNDEIIENSLKELKEELENNRILFNEDKIDIFGETTSDNTKVKTLSYKKHRETKKDKLKILEITQDMEVEEYKNKLKSIIDNIRSAIDKTNKLVSISAYIVLNKKEKLDGFRVFNLNLENVLEEAEDNKKIVLYKVKLKGATRVLYFSNIIYYDNYNKTLQAGMDINAKCLLSLEKYRMREVGKENFRISKLIDEFEIKTKEISLYEYELIEK